MPKKISSNKELFKLQKDYRPYKLNAADLRYLVAHYLLGNKNKNVNIVVNGDTSFGRRKLREIRHTLQQYIALLQDPNKRYAFYLQHFWTPRNVSGESNYYSIAVTNAGFYPFYNEIENKIKLFLDVNGKVRNDLTQEEYSLLNRIGTELSCVTQLDERIDLYQKRCKEDAEERGLSKQDCISEINYIRRLLNSSELVGYIYTNQHLRGSEHFEVLIIARDKIIKPVSWQMSDMQREFSDFDFDQIPFYETYCTFPLVTIAGENIAQIPATPQGNTTNECGTLGLMYLKELLRNSGKQLTELTLQFIYFNELTSIASYFFFPSPQVLRYSQSDRFNKIIVAMLSDTDIETVEHKEKIYQVITIRKLLQDSLLHTELATAELAKNKLLLEKLSEFKKQWLEVYKEIEIQHEQLQETVDDNSKNPRNLYLIYSTRRMERIIKDAQQSQNSNYYFQSKGDDFEKRPTQKPSKKV